MAVNPNTTFTAGQVLTADQQNRFPRGLMTDIVTATTTANLTTGNTTQLTAASFTAVAGRLYRITYYEPRVRGTTNAAGNGQTMYIYNGASNIQECISPSVSTVNLVTNATCVYVGTLPAGATVITAQAVASSTDGTPAFQRTATRFAFLSIEDIGAA
jgi:hypothetical protein